MIFFSLRMILFK